MQIMYYMGFGEKDSSLPFGLNNILFERCFDNLKE